MAAGEGTGWRPWGSGVVPWQVPWLSRGKRPTGEGEERGEPGKRRRSGRRSGERGRGRERRISSHRVRLISLDLIVLPQR